MFCQILYDSNRGLYDANVTCPGRKKKGTYFDKKYINLKSLKWAVKNFKENIDTIF